MIELVHIYLNHLLDHFPLVDMKVDDDSQTRSIATEATSPPAAVVSTSASTTTARLRLVPATGSVGGRPLQLVALPQRVAGGHISIRMSGAAGGQIRPVLVTQTPGSSTVASATAAPVMTVTVIRGLYIFFFPTRELGHLLVDSPSFHVHGDSLFFIIICFI